ncbi:hypothetical protein DID88_001173 [Monilinia fructigena]|uniref:60S ribosomal protein L6 n=1 Tax=Monilinia fructigena TaxID=38457 RepID=A0A395IYH7_9HELO|nr:hypothetical protein DID88_001173 [Monilinia fructigena]
MSATEATQKKTFGKSTRVVSNEKAQKYYPAEDVSNPRKVRKSIRPSKVRPSLEPGKVLILLAGRFRGKRVILLKALDQGVLLVTGPFKVNGVPIRRVNARYVIATSTKVDLDEKSEKKASEEAFFKQGEKPEKKQPSSSRAADQKTIDKAILSSLKKTPELASYLGSSFSLRKGDKPHAMVF